MGNSCIEVATIAIDETMILNFQSTIALLVLLKKKRSTEKKCYVGSKFLSCFVWLAY